MKRRMHALVTLVVFWIATRLHRWLAPLQVMEALRALSVYAASAVMGAVQVLLALVALRLTAKTLPGRSGVPRSRAERVCRSGPSLFDALVAGPMTVAA